LVIFCHGFNITPRAYMHLLEHWVAAGFVVAAPYFPLTRSDSGTLLDEGDIVNQPKDVSVVLTQALRTLGAAIDRRHVVVAGHSDGGSTSFGAGFANAVRDARLAAVMVFSGDRRRSMGNFSAPKRSLPFMLVQSDRDEYNSLDEASRVWAIPPAPKTYLHLYGAKHLPPFSSPCAYRDIVEATTTDFLRAWTTNDPRVRDAARRQLARDSSRPGLSGTTEAR
jgi:predicted dienelactone hydrolase